MTDQTPAEPEKTSYVKFAIPIIIAVLLVAGVGYLTSKKGGVDKALVEGQLQNWIAQVEEQYPETELDYGALEMAGGATDRHAIIKDIRIAYDMPDKDGEPMDVEILLPEVKVEPKNVSFSEYAVTFLQPVRITEDDETTTLSVEPALKADVSVRSAERGERVSYKAPLSGAWRIENSDEPNAVLMTVAEGAQISGEYGTQSRLDGAVSLSVSGLSAVSEDEPDETMTLGSLQLDSVWQPLLEGQGAATLSLSLQELFTDEENMPYGPLNIALEGEYSGPMPEDERAIDWTNEKALVDISNLSIEAADVALNAKLNFQTGRGELLPIGEGQLDVRNFAYVLKELRAREALGDAEAKLLDVLAKQITGTKLDAITDLSIPRKRVDGGSLQVGKSSFEELFAIVLMGGQIMPQAAPAQPAQELIDESEVEALFDE
jgi:hypothetical protein